jgi:hypothetical protein
MPYGLHGTTAAAGPVSDLVVIDDPQPLTDEAIRPGLRDGVELFPNDRRKG